MSPGVSGSNRNMEVVGVVGETGHKTRSERDEVGVVGDMTRSLDNEYKGKVPET